MDLSLFAISKVLVLRKPQFNNFKKSELDFCGKT